jgi:tetratricopeptide (TPR) repeat protein
MTAAWRELQRVKATQPANSALICRLGEDILQKGQLQSLGPDQWTLLEMLAYAACDLKKADLANVCVERLQARFPDSPRVKPLVGMLLEMRGRYDLAKAFYEKELAEDANNIVCVWLLAASGLMRSRSPFESG